MIRVAIAFLLTLLALSTVSAQQPQQFISLGGRFAIDLPRKFDDYVSPIPQKIGSDSYTVSMYKWNTPVGFFTVSYSSTPKYLEEPAQAKEFFRDFRKILTSRLGERGRVIADTEISFDHHPGFQLITESSGWVTAYRVIAILNRYYMLTLALQPNQLDSKAAGEQILGTFRLATSDEIAAMRDALVDSFAAAPLPQTPIVNKPKTDAEDDNLRGKVKSVALARSFYIGFGQYEDRALTSAKNYDERGNLIREIEFNGDVPLSVTAYGYLNNLRVSRKVIKGSPAASKILGADTDPIHQTIQLTRELRARYDNSGLRAEVSIFNSDGKPSDQTLFKYSGNKREIDIWHYDTFLGATTRNHSRRIEMLDDKGDPVEVTEIAYQELPANYYSSNSPTVYSNPTTSSTIERKISEEKYTHKYDYDAEGNWIIRETFFPVKDKQKLVKGPAVITFRTITYW